jgi:hypothetical protein
MTDQASRKSYLMYGLIAAACLFTAAAALLLRLQL